MLDYHLIVERIQADDQGRILIELKTEVLPYLRDPEHRLQLRDMLSAILKADFLQLEAGKTGLRITVKEGSTQASIDKIKEELTSALQMMASLANGKVGPLQ